MTKHKGERVVRVQVLDERHSIVLINAAGGAELIEEVGELTDDQTERHSRPRHEESEREQLSEKVWGRRRMISKFVPDL